MQHFFDLVAHVIANRWHPAMFFIGFAWCGLFAVLKERRPLVWAPLALLQPLLAMAVVPFIPRPNRAGASRALSPAFAS
jgi:hypothetical protein